MGSSPFSHFSEGGRVTYGITRVDEPNNILAVLIVNPQSKSTPRTSYSGPRLRGPRYCFVERGVGRDWE
jgi:hypothetical protein